MGPVWPLMNPNGPLWPLMDPYGPPIVPKWVIGNIGGPYMAIGTHFVNIGGQYRVHKCP